MQTYCYYDVDGDADGLLLRKSDAESLIKQGKLNTSVFKLRFTLLGRNDQDAERRLLTLLGRNDQDAERRLQNMKANSQCR